MRLVLQGEVQKRWNIGLCNYKTAVYEERFMIGDRAVVKVKNMTLNTTEECEYLIATDKNIFMEKVGINQVPDPVTFFVCVQTIN